MLVFLSLPPGPVPQHSAKAVMRYNLGLTTCMCCGAQAALQSAAVQDPARMGLQVSLVLLCGRAVSGV